MNYVETISFLQQKGIRDLTGGIILGTGLGNLVKEMKVELEIPYENIPHFPVSTVESHKGKLVYGTIGGKKMLAMQGRFHFYEGYTMPEIVFPVRVMKMLGIKFLLVSNAAGSLNPAFRKGNLMLADDHLNMFPSHPLLGKNDETMGVRFPDMSEPYSKQMNELMQNIAEENKIALHKGVYAGVPGPMLETRAEYRYLRSIGADAVGMSTVPEIIAASHLRLKAAAVSVLTDECDPDHLSPVSIDEIIAVAGMAEKKLTLLFSEFIKQYS